MPNTTGWRATSRRPARPRLPCGHNTGRQLFWLQRKFPEQFARAKAIVGYAQYWSFLLSGVAANELTALGCHTDLWQPRAADFSPLVDKAGWRKLMPPLRGAGDVLGTIRPEIAARTGLSPHCRVRCGIHDSNATFLRWRLRLQEPFTVASSGTWIILLTAGGTLPANGEHLDCLGNVDALGNLVASARFMGGREYEIIKGDAADDPEPPVQRLAALAANPCFALPAFSDQGGPFAGTRGRFVDANGNDAIPWRRATLAALYAALMTDLSLGPGERARADPARRPVRRERNLRRRAGGVAARQRGAAQPGRARHQPRRRDAGRSRHAGRYACAGGAARPRSRPLSRALANLCRSQAPVWSGDPVLQLTRLLHFAGPVL